MCSGSGSTSPRSVFSGFPGIPNNPEFNLYSVGLTASYALPTSGGIRRQVEEAAARAQAQGFQANAAALTLTGEVATQAATIAALRAEIDTLPSKRSWWTIAATSTSPAGLSRWGGVAQGQRVSAQSQLAADEALLPPLRQTLAAARHAPGPAGGQGAGRLDRAGLQSR